MMKFRGKKGFSLVELMIVVAIIAILAAIAIPSFLRFAMRSKTAEATSNLAAIRTGEEAYRAENDVYISCPTAGNTPGIYPDPIPDSSGTMWVADDSGTFVVIGFAADGVVRYSYSVLRVLATTTDPPYYQSSAQGDLDDDSVRAMYRVSNDPAEALQNAAGQTADVVYPKAILIAGSGFDDL